jgi:hypothetical protein
MERHTDSHHEEEVKVDWISKFKEELSSFLPIRRRKYLFVSSLKVRSAMVPL